MRRRGGFTIIELLVALILLGVASLAVVSLVTNSSESAGEIASVAAQNSKMRSAMAAIQRELSEATSPLVAVDTSTCVGGTGCPAPSGNHISFVRRENTDDGSRVYLVERIQYNDEDPSNDGSNHPSVTEAAYRNTITIQTVRSTTAINSAAQATSLLNSASSPKPKVLLDKVVKPSTADPLFQYYQTATTPSAFTAGNSAWYNTVQLVEVNLRRDEDMKPRESSASASSTATSAQKSPTTRLASSIYLKRIGQQVEGNDDVNC